MRWYHGRLVCAWLMFISHPAESLITVEASRCIHIHNTTFITVVLELHPVWVSHSTGPQLAFTYQLGINTNSTDYTGTGVKQWPICCKNCKYFAMRTPPADSGNRVWSTVSLEFSTVAKERCDSFIPLTKVLKVFLFWPETRSQARERCPNIGLFKWLGSTCGDDDSALRFAPLLLLVFFLPGNTRKPVSKEGKSFISLFK